HPHEGAATGWLHGLAAGASNSSVAPLVGTSHQPVYYSLRTTIAALPQASQSSGRRGLLTGASSARALCTLRMAADPRELDKGEDGQDGEDERLCAVEPGPQPRCAAPDDVSDRVTRPHEGEEDQQADGMRQDAWQNRLRE